jgi:hypothetical protein
MIWQDRETDLIGSESLPRNTRHMAKQATQPQPSTRTIAEDQWIPFLTDFTRENRGGHARLEVLSTDSERYVIEERRFGIDAGDHLTHGVQNVTAILARLPAPPSPGAMLGWTDAKENSPHSTMVLVAGATIDRAGSLRRVFDSGQLCSVRHGGENAG